MEKYYSSERNAQCLVYLLKKHGVKKIVASPGSTNISFVYSAQYDGEFEIYSAADERSAAYIACGLAAESGEPVALSCTGATASRNYMSGLTEAYYRKLPIIAITSSQPECNMGHNKPQAIDRSVVPKDIVKLSVNLPAVHNAQDEWACEVSINKALLEVRHRGGGPVHINLTSLYSSDFSVQYLPEAKVIDRIMHDDKFPEIKEGKIAIFVGAHAKWSECLEKAVDKFCEQYNAVVLCDHTSNYKGKYRVLCPLITNRDVRNDLFSFDLLIHMGSVSGAYIPFGAKSVKEVWRVSEDGELCDTFRRLRYVFEMTERSFFEKYIDSSNGNVEKEHCVEKWKREYERIYEKISELPFSNIWIAKETAKKLPDNSVLHMGILNSLRSWNFFEVSDSILGYSNVGGFGIDGCLSTLLGASMSQQDKIFYAFLGDLAFFYDINSLANRHLGNNLRILLVNNGGGAEFKMYSHIAANLGDKANDYVAALGHYGNKSNKLVKEYAENLGFKYYGVSNKEEYLEILPEFVDEKIGDRPILVEVFVDYEDDSKALKLINSIEGIETKGITKKMQIKKPNRINNIDGKIKIVPWGAGNSFIKYSSALKKICDIEYVCDNDASKWGKEIIDGVVCISPQELEKVENAFVLIMVDNGDVALRIANQLLDMNVTLFDNYNNWVQYANELEYC